MNISFITFVGIHLMGEHATHSLARLVRRLALSLLLAGLEPAASLLRASHLPKRTTLRVQLRFLG